MNDSVNRKWQNHSDGVQRGGEGGAETYIQVQIIHLSEKILIFSIFIGQNFGVSYINQEFFNIPSPPRPWIRENISEGHFDVRKYFSK